MLSRHVFLFYLDENCMLSVMRVSKRKIDIQLKWSLSNFTESLIWKKKKKFTPRAGYAFFCRHWPSWLAVNGGLQKNKKKNPQKKAFSLIPLNITKNTEPKTRVDNGNDDNLMAAGSRSY